MSIFKKRMAVNEACPLNFCFEETFGFVGSKNLKQKIYKKLTLKSSNLFMRGKDFISIAPQVMGIHEPVITKLINTFCDCGYSDFFIDIGANIGLTSCQNGNRFTAVHMFEPNPYCCKILEVNAFLALDKPRYRIHPFGLGNENKSLLLTVPKDNWGGAFINDPANSYDEKILAGKEGSDDLVNLNHFNIEVTIREARLELSQIFRELVKEGLTNGVIKIDVEGFEAVVLKGIAEAIPKEVKIMIVFESLDSRFNINDVLAAFGGRATPYKLFRYTPYKKTWPIAIKFIVLLLKRKFINRVEKNLADDWRGDLILKVN